MSSYTELFSGSNLVKRHWFRSTTINAATITNLVIPAGAKCGIISMVGAGGWVTGSQYAGGGSAFAKTKLNDLVAGETFSVQAGSAKFSFGAGSTPGDSLVTRVNTASIVCRAARGTGTLISNIGQPGIIANCVGDIKRNGLPSVLSPIITGGASGSDATDTHSLGFGGRGAKIGRFPAAGPGGGGIHLAYYDEVSTKACPPGGGLVCFELWTSDPGFI